LDRCSIGARLSVKRECSVPTIHELCIQKHHQKTQKNRGCAGSGDISTATENTSPRPLLVDILCFSVRFSFILFPQEYQVILSANVFKACLKQFLYLYFCFAYHYHEVIASRFKGYSVMALRVFSCFEPPILESLWLLEDPSFDKNIVALSNLVEARCLVPSSCMRT
jgi:hypothetical protein